MRHIPIQGQQQTTRFLQDEHYINFSSSIVMLQRNHQLAVRQLWECLLYLKDIEFSIEW